MLSGYTPTISNVRSEKVVFRNRGGDVSERKNIFPIENFGPFVNNLTLSEERHD